jgi:hypothetical protein
MPHRLELKARDDLLKWLASIATDEREKKQERSARCSLRPPAIVLAAPLLKRAVSGTGKPEGRINLLVGASHQLSFAQD